MFGRYPRVDRAVALGEVPIQTPLVPVYYVSRTGCASVKVDEGKCVSRSKLNLPNRPCIRDELTFAFNLDTVGRQIVFGIKFVRIPLILAIISLVSRGGDDVVFRLQLRAPPVAENFFLAGNRDLPSILDYPTDVEEA